MDNDIRRRDFLRAYAVAGGSLMLNPGPGLHGQGASPIDRMTNMPTDTLAVPGRKVPVIEKTDVCVCGAGPAGASAAIAAARQGAEVRMVDLNGCAGGIWTAGLLCWFQGHKRKTGFINELRLELLDRGAAWDEKKSGMAAEVEEMKVLLEQLCREAGVRVLYHTRVVDARVQGGRFVGGGGGGSGHRVVDARVQGGRVTHAIIENKSGRQAIAADVFIDATGDGDLAARAGCGFDLASARST